MKRKLHKLLYETETVDKATEKLKKLWRNLMDKENQNGVDSLPQNLSFISDALRNPTPGQETVFTVMDDILEGDETGIKGGKRVVLEHRLVNPPAPVRAESLKRAHIFHNAGHFGKYLKKYGSDNTVVLANVEDGTITAILDEKAIGGMEGVGFAPLVHPLWKPWQELAALEKPPSLAEFVEFLMQNRRVITEPTGLELIHLFSQIKASTEIEVHHGRGNDALNGLLLRTKFQGDEKDEHGEIPTAIKISVPLYIETEPREIEFDITLHTKASCPGIITVLVTTGDIVSAKVEAFLDMFREVQSYDDGVEPKWIVALGQDRVAPWSYLPGLAEAEIGYVKTKLERV